MDLQKELQKIDSRLLIEVSDTDEIKIMLNEPLDEYNPYLIPCPIWSERYGFATVYISNSSLTLEQYRKLVEVISHYKGENYYEPPMPAIPLSFSLTQSDIEEALNRSPWYDVKNYAEIMKLALHPEMERIRFKNIPKSYLYHNILLSTNLSTARGKINFLFDLYNAIKFAYPVAFVAARTSYEREILSEYRIQMFKEFGLLGEYDPEVWENIDDQPLDETTDGEKDSPRTYCQVCGRKMTLSNVFKEPGGRISWKFICHYCDTVTQFYDEATEKGEDNMTKNGRTYENIDELNKALKEIDSGLLARKNLVYNQILEINFFANTLVTINHPDSNHLDGYWFQWVNPTEGNCKTLEIIKSAMEVTNNLLTQFNTYTPEGFFDHDDKDSEDEEYYDF